jgi:hypothetical protein
MSKTPNIGPSSVNRTLVLAKISNLIENGRKEITTVRELKKYPIGSMISYMNHDNVFKKGGFIVRFDVNDEYFVYITPDFTSKWRVKHKFVKKMWVGDVYETHNDWVCIHPTKNPETKYKAMIGNTVVYYCKDRTMLKRFIFTHKYDNMTKWYNYFGRDRDEN